MINFINAVLFLASFVAAYAFSNRSLIAEEQMGYKAPFLLKLGFSCVVWISQFITGLIFLWIAKLAFPLLELHPCTWLGFTFFISTIVWASSYIPEPKPMEEKKSLLIQKEEEIQCGPFLREIGLFIMETVERLPDNKLKEARLAWLVQSTRLYYANMDCSYADHVFNILDLEYQDRIKKQKKE